MGEWCAAQTAMRAFLALLLLAALARALSYAGHQVVSLGDVLVVNDGSLAAPPVVRNGSALACQGLLLARIGGWPQATVAWTADAAQAVRFEFRGTVCFAGGCLRVKRLKRFGPLLWVGVVPKRGSVFTSS